MGSVLKYLQFQWLPPLQLSLCNNFKCNVVIYKGHVIIRQYHIFRKFKQAPGATEFRGSFN